MLKAEKIRVPGRSGRLPGKKIPGPDVREAPDVARFEVEAVKVVRPPRVAREIEGLSVRAEFGCHRVALPERQLPLLPQVGERREDELVLAVDADRVGDHRPVGRKRRGLFKDRVAGQVDDRAGREIDREDVVRPALERREQERPAVRRETGRDRLVEAEGQALDDVPGPDVDEKQRMPPPVAGEEGERVSVARPGQAPAEGGIDLVADGFVPGGEALGDVLDDLAVPGREQDDVDVGGFGVEGDRGDEVAGGRDRVGEGEVVGVHREFGAERDAVILRVLPGDIVLEPGPEVALELLGELLRLDAERFLDRIAASDERRGALERREELPRGVLAEALGHELVDGVAEVVGRLARQRVAGIELARLGEIRDPVVEDGVAEDEGGPGRPLPRHVLGQAFEGPERRLGHRVEVAARAAPQDVELEDVGQLVGDEALQLVLGHVAVDADPVEGRLGDAEDALGHFEDVRHLKVGEGRVIEERDGIVQGMLQLGADLLVGAFGHVGDALEDGRIGRVEEDLEVLGGVALPGESLVADLVFAVVGSGELTGGRDGQARGQDGGQEGRAGGSHAGSFSATGDSALGSGRFRREGGRASAGSSGEGRRRRIPPAACGSRR